ncbi:MAG: class I SAM-dependent methyltransferase [Cyclobacteriaceae bacterium]
MTYSLLTPEGFSDYELIDSGNFEKLERFGKFTLIRPEPQAIWNKSKPQEWYQLADATFKREVSKASSNYEKGNWQFKKELNNWQISYKLKEQSFKLNLAPTSFKHVGVFPEQAPNWDFIYNTIQSIPTPKPKVLNLFAYTGGASLAAKAAGGDVTHVDSVKQVISWSRRNMESSKLNDIRWVIEDAFKFVQREVKRGNTYQGIILDPPSYGRGPNGEKWVLEEQLNELLSQCASLLEHKNSFLVLNLYSMGLSPIIAETLLHTHFPQVKEIHSGELYLEDRYQKKLPLGIFSRFRN